MNPQFRRVAIALMAASALIVLSLGVAYAFAITVDGIGTDWGAVSPNVSDPQDVVDDGVSPPEDRVDLKSVFFTTDATKLYWRFDTWGTPTRWTKVGGVAPYVRICMNTDNNTGTGSTIPQCNNQAGVDYELRVTGSTSGVPSVQLLDLNGDPVVGATPAVGFQTGTGNITEVSVPLSQVGLAAGYSCGGSQTIVAVLYFDNQDSPNDDNAPDSGTFSVTIPCPTAVNLASLGAQSDSATPVIPIAALGFVAVGAVGVVTVTRRRK